jgi:hypothetical protein
VLFAYNKQRYVGNVQKKVTQLFQEIESVTAEVRLVGIDHHIVKEGIDRRPQAGKGSEGIGVLTPVQMIPAGLGKPAQAFGKCFFLRLLK